jgi:hypothetical protein
MSAVGATEAADVVEDDRGGGLRIGGCADGDAA